MKYYTLKNLSSREITPVDSVAECEGAYEVPTDKADFNVWKSLPDTDHIFYNGTEGLTPTLRVDVDNPPKFLHGFVCEYDADIGDEMVAKISKNGSTGLLPTWVSSSRFRNGRRLVFEFEKPVFVDNPEITERFMRLFAKEAKLKNLLPGLDENFYKVTQYQELGKDWKRIGEPIANVLLQAIFFKAAGAKPVVDGAQIPLDAIAAEVEKKWPGKWPGAFSEGARGPLFWVDPFVDRVGCQVGEFGMLCYSDRAGKSFVPWREVLGHDFVRNFEAACIGKAVEDVYYDNQSYWSLLANGTWCPNKKEDISDDLIVRNNLKPPQVKEALSIIRGERRITGVFPFVHCKQVLVDTPAGRFLNITTRKLMQPADKDGPFPWLKEYFEKIWSEDYREIQRDTFLAWIHRSYASAYQGNIAAGQASIIAGDTNMGKTLLNYKIMGAAMGGYCDASSFLLGKTAFNKEAVETYWWAVDDDRGGHHWESHDQFSNALKRFVANPSIPYHPKFRDEVTVPWRGRICVTCNLDEKSLGIIPGMDSSNKDKISLYMFGTWKPDFVNVKIEQVLEQELPFFLRWLLNWTPPDYVMGDSRFGTKSFQHPYLLQASHDASPAGQLSEMLAYAVKTSIINDKKLPEMWMNATEIRQHLDRNMLGKFNGNRLGIALSELSKAGKGQIKETRRVKGIKEYLVSLR